MITQQDKETLNIYANTKAEIKLLESRIEEIAPIVLGIMQGAEVEEINLEDKGKLSLSSRRIWTYSKKLQEEEKALKAEKKIEEQTGKADYKENHFVVFKGIKENYNE